MKVIVAGSRTITDLGVVARCIIDTAWPITEIVSGRARGVDLLGERYAEVCRIPCQGFPVTADEWRRLGAAAGHLRNGRMANYADALIAVWDGSSPGTRNMIRQATCRGLRVAVCKVPPANCSI